MEFLTNNFLTIFSSIFGTGGIIMYVLERRKNTAITKGVEADVESKEIDNGSKVIDLYKQALDDLEQRSEKKFLELEKMYTRKTELLEKEIFEIEKSYKRKVKLLEDENRLKNKVITALRKDLKEKEARIKLLSVQVKNGSTNS